MDRVDVKSQIDQLESVIELLAKLRRDALSVDQHDQFITMQVFLTRSKSAICRISGSNSVYDQQFERVLRDNQPSANGCLFVAGILEGLKSDLSSGYLNTVRELLHGELFGEFLEMADHLLSEGYKDASAVIVGGTLEGHLRQLCSKHDIAVDLQTGAGLRPKKADTINSELSGVAAYSKLDQKNVTAWLDLRNKAAHGQYNDYSKEQVALFLLGVRDFITRITA